MMTDAIATTTLLKKQPHPQQPQSAPAQPDAEPKDAKAPGHEDLLLCRQCRAIITRPSDRIDIDGAHMHTFANPMGIVFEIGCFRSSPGCGHVGPTSDEFAWFAGYSWRIAICGQCRTHLGWLFISTSRDQFHGLILDRLLLSALQ